MRRSARAVLLVLLLAGGGLGAQGQAPVSYRLAFADNVHHLLDVEVSFADVPPGPLQLRMSRSSPGRYALHEFAKNVFDVRATDATGKPLTLSHPDPQEWDVADHGGTVRVTYRVFGDRTDGTYLSIDPAHAHINMPSALMWARGFELRPVSLHLAAPPGTGWRVATQLLPGADPFTYTAPNLQYLMDSPTEFSALSMRTFTINDNGRAPTFRLAVHHDGSEADLDSLVRDVEKIVREEHGVFGEFPAYDGNSYTFIADYLPWASRDGMEHRNSTIVTSSSSIRNDRADIIDAIAHEFFHSWNVERIRPRSLEPFNFDDANMSGELWLAEGFTNYYGPLSLLRAGLTSIADFCNELGGAVDAVVNGPGRRLRSVVEMSQHAPFTDAATSIDRTNTDNTFISYYTWGSTIGLGLDLTLRDRTDNRVTLDDYMRALWQKYGKPGGRIVGYVDHAYTMADLEATLAEVAGDSAFAHEFFDRYVRGRDVVDYARLLDRAGLMLREVAPGAAYAGALQLQDVAGGGARVAALVPLGTPAYDAGLERDAVLLSLAGTRIDTAADFTRIVQGHRAGESLPLVFDRRGQRATTMLTLVRDPRLTLVPAESAGTALSDSQKRFRTAWLSSRARNAF
jgi:predicted metalloprotease with PDZ domain